jgi:hypothetical protein
VFGPPAEPATASPASRRHAGRKSLPPSVSLVAAAVAPLGSWHVKPAAAYTKNVRPALITSREREGSCRDITRGEHRQVWRLRPLANAQLTILL